MMLMFKISFSYLSFYGSESLCDMVLHLSYLCVSSISFFISSDVITLQSTSMKDSVFYETEVPTNITKIELNQTNTN